jgi:23S rRNA (guanosine2251-2'-O)-methyltransferase
MRKLQTNELNRLSVEAFRQSEKIPVVLVLDNIRSQHNIGSVFRTADAFRVASVYLCGITATPPHREIHKTALGATESVHWKYFEHTLSALQELRKEGFTLVGVEQTEQSTELQHVKHSESGKFAFIFGNEVHGIDDHLLMEIDDFVEIPQFGTKHSFNISVTVGIILWDFLSKVRFRCNHSGN